MELNIIYELLNPYNSIRVLPLRYAGLIANIEQKWDPLLAIEMIKDSFYAM